MNHAAHSKPAAEDVKLDPAPEHEPAGVSLADIFRALLKNKALIVTCTCLAVLCAAAYVAVSKPVYEANASIRIDPGRAGSLGLSDLLSLSGGELNSDQTATEITVLKSDAVALAALNSLTPEQFQTYAGFEKERMNFSPTDQRLPRNEEELLGAFKASLAVKQIEGTQLIELSFRNGNPENTALIVNHVIAAYLRQNFDSRYNSVNQAKTWLSAQMDELKDRAATAQKKLADFQEKNNLLGADASNNTTFDRLKLLNESLTQAQSNRIVKEAQMRVAMTGDSAVLASLLPDTKLQTLQTEEGTLYAQYIELSTKFGAAYPPLADVKQQLARVKAQIAEDVGVISGHLKEDYDISSRTEGMLRKEYAAETAKAYALNRTQADYAVLVAEGTSSRDLFNTLQYKLQQASVDAGLNSVNTMVVDRARVPLRPIAPKKTSILAFGFMLGLAAGVGGSLLKESLADEIQNPAQLEEHSGLVNLATVPHLDLPQKPNGGGEKLGMQPPPIGILAVRDPHSRGAEAYRTLRNSLLFYSLDHPVRTILVTSPNPGEGKSFTSANYAVVLAQRGNRVLLVDADLRRPGLHKYFGLANENGLADRLTAEDGVMTIHKPIQELAHLEFLPAGAKPAFPSEALGSNKFHRLLEAWEKEYDYVILDSAPILVVSDSLPLASWADLVVIVVRAGITPLQTLLRTKSILLRAHARIGGVVFNDATGLGTEYGYYSEEANDYYE